MFRKTKCGLPSHLVSILPLSKENRAFVFDLDREKCEKCQEFDIFLKTASQFLRHYTMSPWDERENIKLNYKDELTAQCEELKNKLSQIEKTKD